MKNRTLKSVFAVTGTPEELLSFEQDLISNGIEGVSSNPSARNLGYKWIVVYADCEEGSRQCTVSFAYRGTSCKHTSKPAIIKLKTAKKRIVSGFYFSENATVFNK